MTKEEFINYVESFNKQPGEFTQEEILEIGIQHKTLAIQDKSWADLADSVGWQGTGESLRSFINRNVRAVNDMNKAVESEEFRKIYAQKTQLRDTYNAYKRDIRDEARIQTFKEEIQEAARCLKTLPVVDPGKVKAKEVKREAILNFSDLHIGPEFKNSYNEYNYKIATQRVSKLVKYVIDYCKLYNVQRLNVLNLGDLISGLIHVTIRLEQQLNLTDQIMKAGELVAEMLNELQAAAPEVTYRSVVDNHARVVANKDLHIEAENFSKIIDWFIEERLKDSKIKFMHDNIDDGIGKFELMSGKKVMFAHGHQDSPDKSMQGFFGVTREFIDYICLAHYHNSKEKSFNGMKVFVNGSVIGTDTYAYGKRLFGDPEQKLLIFDDNNVVDIDINLK